MSIYSEVFEGAEKENEGLLAQEARDAAATGNLAAMQYIQSMGKPEDSGAAKLANQQMPNIGGATSPMKQAQPQQQPAQPQMSLAQVAQSVLKKNPGLQQNPAAFIQTMDTLKGFLAPTDKDALERMKLQFEMQKYQNEPEHEAAVAKAKAIPESPAGKVQKDIESGILKPGNTGPKISISQLPDAQTRKQALLDQEIITSTPDILDSFSRALAINKDTFDSDMLQGDTKATITRKMGDMAPDDYHNKMVATTNFTNIINRQVLPQLKGFFGSRPTQYEAKMLKDIEGSTGLSIDERENSIREAMDYIQQKNQESRDSLDTMGVGVMEPTQRNTGSQAAIPKGKLPPPGISINGSQRGSTPKAASQTADQEELSGELSDAEKTELQQLRDKYGK